MKDKGQAAMMETPFLTVGNRCINVRNIGWTEAGGTPTNDGLIWSFPITKNYDLNIKMQKNLCTSLSRIVHSCY